jgi:hypothetical protein
MIFCTIQLHKVTNQPEFLITILTQQCHRTYEALLIYFNMPLVTLMSPLVVPSVNFFSYAISL